MKKIAVMIFGPPGSGKGTQADLLARKFGLIHFDTGRFLEGVVHDVKRQKERIVRRERRLFDTGKLMTPSFVLREASREVKRIAAADFGVVFSGSPRTLYEVEGLVPLLEKLYGRKKVIPFVIRVPPRISVERNTSRLVCSSCGYLLLTAYYPVKRPKYCPICGGSFYRRTLDTPAVMKVRLREYHTRTVPVFAYLERRHYRLFRVDGRPAPYKVSRKISAVVARFK